MSANSPQLPLKTPRIILLSLTWAVSVIGGSVGINAIVKRNIQVAYVQNSAPPGVTVDVDTKTLVDPGILLAVGCAVLSIITSLWLGLLTLDLKRKTTTSTRTLPLQWASLAFMSIWLLATAIPVTYIARTGSATVTAWLGSTQLPASIVAAQSEELGVDPAYWSNDFVHLQVIPPWVALGFAIVTTVVSFIASRESASATDPHTGVVDADGADSHFDKHAVAEKENV